MKAACFLITLTILSTSLADSAIGQKPDSGLLSELWLAYRTGSPVSHLVRGHPSERVRSLEAILSRRNSPEHLIALHYALALISRSPNRHTDSLVREVLRMRSMTGPAEFLPGALLRIYDERHNSRSFHHLTSLRLDGGPAETLKGVRGLLFLHYPNTCARYIMKAYGSVDATKKYFDWKYGGSFVTDVLFQFDYPSESDIRKLQEIRRRASTSKAAESQYLEELVTAMLEFLIVRK